jgi:hypothetical protein
MMEEPDILDDDVTWNDPTPSECERKSLDERLADAEKSVSFIDQSRRAILYFLLVTEHFM